MFLEPLCQRCWLAAVARRHPSGAPGLHGITGLRFEAINGVEVGVAATICVDADAGKFAVGGVYRGVWKAGCGTIPTLSHTVPLADAGMCLAISPILRREGESM